MLSSLHIYIYNLWITSTLPVKMTRSGTSLAKTFRITRVELMSCWGPQGTFSPSPKCKSANCAICLFGNNYLSICVENNVFIITLTYITLLHSQHNITTQYICKQVQLNTTYNLTQHTLTAYNPTHLTSYNFPQHTPLTTFNTTHIQSLFTQPDPHLQHTLMHLTSH